MVLKSLFEWLVSPLSLAIAAPTSHAIKMDVQLVGHIQAGLPEQDVFIERGDLVAGRVVRPEASDAKEEANQSKMLYAAATAVRDDPFKVGADPLGPFTKGKALGITLQQWLAARGSGTYILSDGSAELKLSLEQLVPNGVYTVLTPRITFPPNFQVEPGIAGAPDGSEAMLKADAKGNAVFNLRMKALPESTKQTATAIILAYNSEGAWRGEFGKNTHQQLFFLMPPPSGI